MRLYKASNLQAENNKRDIMNSFQYSAFLAHFALYGTSADIPSLSLRGVDFVLDGPGYDAKYQEEAAKRYQEGMNFAIDAIRMSGR